MFKHLYEIIVIVIIIIACLVLGNITTIFGGSPGFFSQDLVAIAKGIPLALGLIGGLALLTYLWSRPAGKVLIAVIAIAVVIIGIIF